MSHMLGGGRGLCPVTFHGGNVKIAYQSLLSPFSDVLCPSVRVEGDRFKHTNGGTKEITGTRNSQPAQLAL